MVRTKVVALGAALGGALLLLAPLAPTAGAGTNSLDIYAVQGAAQGLVFDFTIEPSIFTPLVHAGIGYAESTATSQGGGSAYALASPVYPSKFAIGALGCAGLPGHQWAQAKYPPAGGCETKDDGAAIRYPDISRGEGEVLTLESTGNHAAAGEGTASALASAGRTALRGGNPASPPFLQVESLRVEGLSRRTTRLVEQTSRVTATGISLEAGGIKVLIDTVASTAFSRSDGALGTARGTLTISGVSVLAGGTRHEATIERDGIHVRDPLLNRDEQANLDHTISAALDAVGVTITVSHPVEIVDEAAAEATVGGLLITIRGTVPSARIPRELAPVLRQVFEAIPEKCLYELLPPPLDAPLCFGEGVLPGPGSPMVANVNIASAVASSLAAEGFSFDFEVPSDGAGAPGGLTGGLGGPVVAGGPFTPPPAPAPPEAAPPSQQPAAYGLVARMPSAALAGTGAAFLVFALGLLLAPSLRR